MEWFNVYDEQDMDGGKLYITGGGGPETGYLVMPDSSVFSMYRNWGIPWRKTPMRDAKVLLRKDTGNMYREICVIEA